MGETNQMSSRWADEIDDDEYGTEIAPTSQEVTIKDGERIVAEIKVDPDTGKKTKIIRTFKLEKKFVSKGVIDRKRLAKYGQSKKDPPGPNSATTVLSDEVLMQFLTKEQDQIPEESQLAKMNEPKFVKCRFCQENHFTAKCPFKDPGMAPEAISSTKDMDEPKKVDSDSKPGIFVPPALRGGNRRGETMGSAAKKDEYTIRVSNLPESMSETDMQELCNPFGKTDRIFLAKDRTSGVCKGFAFVTYQTKDNAARALQSLNGYGYDHLILNVEWSKPANN
ncbi:unnamed protein product [Allacma fusca]|uniref:Eukaryotic translation initiation factor 3 subunit G n=1 Tax=Allacma fusca TaxID=39272 RepID=A0A8J2P3G7_9HEXA|nr:unnamed protein product [Allacma fusca]